MILPFTLLRRLDQVLEPTKPAVLETVKKHANSPDAMKDHLFRQAAGPSDVYDRYREGIRRSLSTVMVR